MVLPCGRDGSSNNRSAKYVDTGVPLLIQEMIRQGAMKSRLVIKIAGGANILSVPGLEARLNIGERNLEAVRAAVAKERVSIHSADVGGNLGRTVRLVADTGEVTVRTVGRDSFDL